MLLRNPDTPHRLSRRTLPALLPLLGLLVSFVSLAAPARADDKKLFDYREITLDNGLRVVTLEDFSCPIVVVHLWYHVGSKDENPERQGFAHMFEHMMFRGTDRLGPTDHFDYIRRTGGECNAYTAFDNTTYIQTLPANQLEMALWLEAERMAFLKIDQNAFDTERKVVEEERRLGLNRPYGTLPEKLLPEVFPTHPYRWSPIGRIPHLRAAAVQELRDFWTRYYVPNNATLVIVGAVKHEEAQKLAQQYFGWIPRYPDPPRITIRDPQPKEARAITIKEDNAPAPLCGVGFRTVPVGHDDYVPLQMLGMILGGGQSSRIYRDLVAENQIAMVALAAAFSLEQDGIFGAAAVLSPFGGDTKKAMAAIEKQLERIRTEPVTEQELTKARNQMLAGLVTQNLSVESKASRLGNAAVLQGDTANVNKEIDRIRRVTPEELLRVAKTYLAPEHALKITIERNLLGAIFGKKGSSKEDEAPITAEPETTAPPPGRTGLARPRNFPQTPPVAKMLDFDPTPKFSSQTLPNGLKVMVVPNHEVPYISVTLGLLNGAWTESKPGTANMAMDMLTKGTAKHDEGQLASELETYAISLGGGASLDVANVNAGCLTEHLDRAMGLLAEAVLTPTFPEKEFDKLRKQTRTGLAISSAEPGYLADREFRKLLYGNHPYARTPTGELEDLDALKVEDLKDWWGKFARPDMAVLIFSGDIEQDRAMKVAEAALGSWKAAGPKPEVALPPLPQGGPKHIYLLDHPGVQSQIRVGQLAITQKDPAWFTARVTGDYFGGAFSSRLNETIRVKKGLTYGAGGGYSASRFAGQFRASTFSKTESTAEAVKAVFDELERLRTEPPTAEELGKTKSYILGSFPGDRETPQQVASSLWAIEYLGLPGDYYQKMLAGVAKADADACMKLIKDTVDPSKMAIIVVGNAAKIKEDLEKIAPVTLLKRAEPSLSDKEKKAADDQ